MADNFYNDILNFTKKIYRNYMDGLLYENNCIKKFLSYFEDEEITILPNLFFYIKSNYVEQISKSKSFPCILYGKILS